MGNLSSESDFANSFDDNEIKNEEYLFSDQSNENSKQPNNGDVEKKQGYSNSKDNYLQKLVNSCRIDLSEKLSPPPVAIEIKSNGELITLFTKGNFSIITGPAKSRKTFLVSMLMASAINGSFQDIFHCNNKGINLLFDTEQSRYKVQQNAKRICRLAATENPLNFHAYSLRIYEPKQRIELIEWILRNTPNINFVAIDGIIDLQIDPILQVDQAQFIVSKLMKWTEIYNIHITCVLHFNKTTDKLAGHLGTFTHRKADSIIMVVKDTSDKYTSIVKAVDCREEEFEPFAFSVDHSGIPFILKDYTFEKQVKEIKVLPKVVKKIITPGTIEQTIHDNILKNVFKRQKEWSYCELWQNIKNSYEVVTKSFIGDSKAKSFLTYYIDKNEIVKTELKGSKPFYTRQGQVDLDLAGPV